MNPDDSCPLPLREQAISCAAYLLDFARWTRHASRLRSRPCECRELLQFPGCLEQAAFALDFERLLYNGRGGDVFDALVFDWDFGEIRRATY